MAMYDLMHGDELYKQIMCDRYKQLQWLVLQRRRFRFTIENLALAVKRRLHRGMRCSCPASVQRVPG